MYHIFLTQSSVQKYLDSFQVLAIKKMGYRPKQKLSKEEWKMAERPHLWQSFVCLELAQVLPVLSQPLGVHMCNRPATSGKRGCSTSDSYHLSSPSSAAIFSLGRMGWDIFVWFWTESSTVFYSLHLGSLWMSVLIINYWDVLLVSRSY